MASYFLGHDQNSSWIASSQGSSLAVRQFVDVARGWIPVHTPSQPWRVVTLIMDERYCMGCFDVRIFDVLCGMDAEAAFCRCCGKEADSG